MTHCNGLNICEISGKSDGGEKCFLLLVSEFKGLLKNFREGYIKSRIVMILSYPGLFLWSNRCIVLVRICCISHHTGGNLKKDCQLNI